MRFFHAVTNAGKNQHATIGDQTPGDFFHGHIRIQTGESNRPSLRRYPGQKLPILMQERFYIVQIIPDDLQISPGDLLIMAQSNGCQKFTGGAVAYGSIIFESGQLVYDRTIAGVDPADPQTRQTKSFGHYPQGYSVFIKIARPWQPVLFPVFQISVYFIGKQQDFIGPADLDDFLLLLAG